MFGGFQVFQVLRIEGVNFEDTLLDTNDISVIRGASMAIEGAGARCAEALIAQFGKRVIWDYSAGEQSLFSFSAELEADDVLRCALAALSEPPWCHLNFTVATAQAATVEKATLIAEARARTQQFQTWSVKDITTPNAKMSDALDQTRPAAQVDPRGIKGQLSEATFSRLEYGRNKRRTFYDDVLGPEVLKGYGVCNSFEEMVATQSEAIPLSARSKIAVIHLDGDRFSNHRASTSAPEMSASLKQMQAKVLSRLLGDALAVETEEFGTEAPRLRFETLLWGGDDITIIVPAWRAFMTLIGFYDEIRNTTISGVPVTFSAACIIANYKSPIRRLVGLADRACSLNKASGVGGGVSFDIFESIEVPEVATFATQRLDRFGVHLRPQDVLFPSDQLAQLQSDISSKNGQTSLRMSRTQLHQIFSSGGDPEQAVEDYAARVLGAEGLALDQLRLPAVQEMRPAWADLEFRLMLHDYGQQYASKEVTR